MPKKSLKFTPEEKKRMEAEWRKAQEKAAPKKKTKRKSKEIPITERKIKDTRSKKAKAIDRAKKAKKTVVPTAKNLKKWKKNPNRVDLEEYDTKLTDNQKQTLEAHETKQKAKRAQKKQAKREKAKKSFKTLGLGLNPIHENNLIKTAKKYTDDIKTVDFQAIIDPTLTYSENKEILVSHLSGGNMSYEFDPKDKPKTPKTQKAPAKKGGMGLAGALLIGGGAIAAAYFLTRGGGETYGGGVTAGSVPSLSYPGIGEGGAGTYAEEAAGGAALESAEAPDYSITEMDDDLDAILRQEGIEVVNGQVELKYDTKTEELTVGGQPLPVGQTLAEKYGINMEKYGFQETKVGDLEVISVSQAQKTTEEQQKAIFDLINPLNVVQNLFGIPQAQTKRQKTLEASSPISQPKLAPELASFQRTPSKSGKTYLFGSSVGKATIRHISDDTFIAKVAGDGCCNRLSSKAASEYYYARKAAQAGISYSGQAPQNVRAEIAAKEAGYSSYKEAYKARKEQQRQDRLARQSRFKKK